MQQWPQQMRLDILKTLRHQCVLLLLEKACSAKRIDPLRNPVQSDMISARRAEEIKWKTKWALRMSLREHLTCALQCLSGSLLRSSTSRTKTREANPNITRGEYW